jgi:hypothetical protein
MAKWNCLLNVSTTQVICISTNLFMRKLVHQEIRINQLSKNEHWALSSCVFSMNSVPGIECIYVLLICAENWNIPCEIQVSIGANCTTVVDFHYLFAILLYILQHQGLVTDDFNSGDGRLSFPVTDYFYFQDL